MNVYKRYIYNKKGAIVLLTNIKRVREHPEENKHTRR